MDTDNAILTGDCLGVLNKLPAGVADLVCTDPPFNLGLEYPGYDDRRPPDEYLTWLKDRLQAARRVLKPTGSLVVAIGADYQAEVCVLLKGLGFHWRNTVVWHYGFGPCQKKKFTPSWVALHYFVMDRERFTFNGEAVRVPSARQLAYKDRRAKDGGKTPDDVWFLRPRQAEAAGLFGPSGDAWHLRRVAGTFQERVGHVCQMPVEVLERVIRATTNPGDLVIDPFAGTGTTLVAARDLGRRYLGVELCEATANLARRRLAETPEEAARGVVDVLKKVGVGYARCVVRETAGLLGLKAVKKAPKK
jgi:site-specific DNA-methyltransferase (adenine-specific)